MDTSIASRKAFGIVAMSLLVSACGGGDGSDGGGGASADPATTAALAVSLLELSSPQAALERSSPQTATSDGTTPQAAAKAMQTCGSGSTETRLGLDPDAGSPYTDQAFVTTTADSNACSFSYGYDGHYIQSSGTQTLTGTVVAGNAIDAAGSYAFLKIGDSGAPLSFTAQANATVNRAAGARAYTFDLSDSTLARIDRRVAAAVVDEQWLSSQSGSYSFVAPEHSFSGSYSLDIGSTSAPFLYHADSSGKTFNGVIAYDVNQAQVPEECRSATLNLETLEPLVASNDRSAPYAGGVLRITSDNGAVITMTFQADGDALVDAGEGSQSYRFPALRALAEDCVTAIHAAFDARAAQ